MRKGSRRAEEISRLALQQHDTYLWEEVADQPHGALRHHLDQRRVQRVAVLVEETRDGVAHLHQKEGKERRERESGEERESGPAQQYQPPVIHRVVVIATSTRPPRSDATKPTAPPNGSQSLVVEQQVCARTPTQPICHHRRVRCVPLLHDRARACATILLPACLAYLACLPARWFCLKACTAHILCGCPPEKNDRTNLAGVVQDCEVCRSAGLAALAEVRVVVEGRTHIGQQLGVLQRKCKCKQHRDRPTHTYTHRH